MTAVRTHDFRRSETLDRQYVRTLNAAFDTFARHGSVELSTSLRKSTQLTISSLAEMAWRDVIEILGDLPYLAMFKLEPLHGTVICSIPLPTAVRMLDFRLGGGTQPSFDGHTTMTETDFAVLAGVMTPLLDKLAASLSRVKEVSAALASQESSIQFVQLAAASEMFLVARFALTIADDDPIGMIFALPFPIVRQITEAMRSGTLALSEAATPIDESVLLSTPVECWLELPSVSLSSREVAEIEVGDVIRFFHPISQPLDLRAEGVLVARASHGSSGSKTVCSILEEVMTNDD